jgi:hypothetical protein
VTTLVICAYSDAQATAYLLKRQLREGPGVVVARTPADVRHLAGKYRVVTLNGFFARANARDIAETLRKLAGASTSRRRLAA